MYFYSFDSNKIRNRVNEKYWWNYIEWYNMRFNLTVIVQSFHKSLHIWHIYLLLVVLDAVTDESEFFFHIIVGSTLFDPHEQSTNSTRDVYHLRGLKPLGFVLERCYSFLLKVVLLMAVASKFYLVVPMNWEYWIGYQSYPFWKYLNIYWCSINETIFCPKNITLDIIFVSNISVLFHVHFLFKCYYPSNKTPTVMASKIVTVWW